MKNIKTLLIGILCLGCLLLAGCGSDASGGSAAQDPTAQPSADPTASSDSSEEEEVSTASAATDEIDLTKMSSTMVYSYVYNITTAPDEFLGKRFRVAGTYDESYWEQTQQTYSYIVIADASACCAQGLEFILTDANASYPKVGDEIELSGILTTYLEEGSLYLHIEADSMEIR